MLNIFKKPQNRKRFQAIIFIMIIAVFFVNVKYSLAATSAGDLLGNGVLGVVGAAVAQILALIAYILTAVIGLLITVVVALLIQVAQYGNIINVPTVIKGWVIIRDLCNMSFILILLIIAFATILRQENFSAKKMLPKLLLMAILINFSRTIFGLLIDVSQIIMLTFVNAFSAGGGWFIEAFQTSKLLTFKGDTSGNVGTWAVSQWSTAMAVIAGVLAAIITLIVVSVILAVLVARIVMLWIYTIFSPLIFLGFAFTPLQKYTGKLWEDFTKQLVVGPVLAFFIWLALTTASPSGDMLAKQSLISGVPAENTEVCVGAGAFFCTGQGGNAGNLQKFIIVIGLLMGGLMVAQQMGGAAGSLAGKGLDWAKRAPGMLGKGTMKAGSWAGRKFGVATGIEVRPTQIIAGIKHGLAMKKEEEDQKIKEKAGTMLQEGKIRGALGASTDFTKAAAHGFLWNRLWNPLKDEKGVRQGVLQQMLGKRQITKGVEDLKKQKEELIIQRSAATSESDRKIIKAKIDEKEREIVDQIDKLGKFVHTPNAFYARQETLSAYDKAANESGVEDNEEEIVDTLHRAIKNHDVNLAVGMILHAPKVGHSNEILENSEALEDIYNDKGELETKKGEFIRNSNAGLKAFFKQYVQDKLGLSEQQALLVQSHYSSRAKEVNHYDVAESVGSRHGLLFARSDTVQKNRAHGELMKRDAERVNRDFNRLGTMDEEQYRDGVDAKGKDIIRRRAIVNELTVKTFVKNAGATDIEIAERKRLNSNFSENNFNTYMLHQKYKQDPEKFKRFKEDSIVEAMERIGGGFKNRENQEISYEQLALEVVAFGGDKRVGSLQGELQDLILAKASATAIKAKEDELKEAEKILKEVKGRLKDSKYFQRPVRSK